MSVPQPKTFTIPIPKLEAPSEFSRSAYQADMM